MVSVQSEAVNDTTIDLCEYICTALNRQSIKRFLKINFSGLDESEYPTLSFAKASVKMPWWQRSSADFVNFIQAGVLSMTEEDERMIRMSSGLPPISDDDAPDAPGDAAAPLANSAAAVSAAKKRVNSAASTVPGSAAETAIGDRIDCDHAPHANRRSDCSDGASSSSRSISSKRGQRGRARPSAHTLRAVR